MKAPEVLRSPIRRTGKKTNAETPNRPSERNRRRLNDRLPGYFTLAGLKSKSIVLVVFKELRVFSESVALDDLHAIRWHLETNAII